MDSDTDLEAFPPSEYQVTQRHAHVVVHDLAMPLRRVVVAHDLHGPDDLHAGRVRRHEDDALLVVAVRVIWVALPENEVYGTARIPCTADPPTEETMVSAQ